MNKAMLCAIACLCICLPVFAAEPPGNLPIHRDPTADAIREREPRLAELFEKTVEQYQAVLSQTKNEVADETARRRLVEWHNVPRPAEEAGYIVDCLLKAKAQDPPDWLSVRAALMISLQGVPDLRVVAVARELVASVRELPDQALTVLGPATVLLILSGEEQDIELITSCTSRGFVGAQVEPDGTGHDKVLRKGVCQDALIALYMHAPLDRAIPALRKIVEQYKNSASGNRFDAFMSSLAQRDLERLERVRKGEKVVLPYVE